MKSIPILLDSHRARQVKNLKGEEILAKCAGLASQRWDDYAVLGGPPSDGH